MIWLIVIVLLLIYAYYKSVKPLSYWKDRGVAHKKALPLIGNSSIFFLKHKSFMDYVKDFYNEFPNERYYGIHQFSKPLLYVRDLELIKQITVKDFDQFTDHNNFVAENLEPLMSRNLLNLKGQEWRDMRATLSPSFTSSKIKTMFALLSECAKDFVEFFEKKGEDTVTVEMKDVFTRFTNDAIASTAFGFKCDSLRDGNNEFFVMGKDATNFSGFRIFLLSIIGLFPFIQKIVKIDMLSQTVSSFFRRVIKETIDKRDKEGLVRPDMIHLLLQARKGNVVQDEPDVMANEFAAVEESKIHHGRPSMLQLTDEDITAQALIFFFGGFDTAASAMAFMSHELAINPEVQKKLQTEIDATLNESNGKLTYYGLQKMKYMDMVVSETLRKWPPGFQLDRQCVKDYVVEPVKPHERTLTIEKGSMIIIPVMGIHYDPQYYPNPEMFDPERFNDDNSIEPYSYLPFGSGPRNCIASRFALMEVKTLMFHLLSKFDLVATDRTQVPLKLSKTKLSITAEEGIWLGLKRRHTNKL
ncbi:hypothetical protein RI129_010419 [Pyrocoelia pectoralis]|uniref:Cytochrome P450 n=1 Tax=Pyrocoelia pectoralis TaxID=417401 RepID=A0AAN7ZH19_9COLE